MTSATNSKVFSAPGKVFLAGGYLVLDRAYTALVFGLDARIHVLIRSASTKDNQIVVESPQFRDSKWVYNYSSVEGGVKVDENRT